MQEVYLKGAAEILYRNTEPTEISSFESIEKSLRQKMLEEVGPELATFFFQQDQLEFRLSRSKSAIAARLAHVYTPTATVAGDRL